MPGLVTYVAQNHAAIALIFHILSHAIATRYTQELQWSFAV